MFRSKYGYLYCIFLLTLETFLNVYRSIFGFNIQSYTRLNMFLWMKLTRWKNGQHHERETFSDEDPDEDDSDYEEVVIPKKK